MILYHGTSWKRVPSIIADGILPRTEKTPSNWGHTVPSKQDFVYLTDAYAIYFGGCTEDVNVPNDENAGVDVALIEVDIPEHDDGRPLYPDEDWLAQASIARADLPDDVTLFDATRAATPGQYPGDGVRSLLGLGTCAVRNVRASEITRVARLSWKRSTASMQVLSDGMEPCITLMNYAILGGYYRELLSYVFNNTRYPTRMEIITPGHFDKIEADAALTLRKRMAKRDGIDVYTMDDGALLSFTKDGA